MSYDSDKGKKCSYSVLIMGTIQKAIDSGDTVMAWCHNPTCRHKAQLDWEVLKARLGPDHGTLHHDLVPKLKCSKCGGKEIGLTLSNKAAERASQMIYRAYVGKYD